MTKKYVAWRDPDAPFHHTNRYEFRFFESEDGAAAFVVMANGGGGDETGDGYKNRWRANDKMAKSVLVKDQGPGMYKFNDNHEWEKVE